MVAGLIGQQAGWELPALLGMVLVLGIGDLHVGRQAVGEGATSRAVPHEGQPVSENGCCPGSLIFPVRRWML